MNVCIMHEILELKLAIAVDSVLTCLASSCKSVYIKFFHMKFEFTVSNYGR